ncbi:hypothetical protein FRACYDRAFT_245609 [Fragilariopsis cylindrus CCMP1102]|uniref:Major facilitator superfamily associated domain-containing protein n=1 Tax=Fragilariopsis cylindrus CCMP1102 TaxID=635003 RepID=A0A1E7F169_9STRA|nr:hypothetical protein FRACYDRAFT_245609 [Fragilariopsis cylindrus CCMP1102]|eukprot:OEU11553.1 hypothetical protein FRACYDRAFT_245609 [Fragilariopsis cylindrus CCMP1102]
MNANNSNDNAGGRLTKRDSDIILPDSTDIDEGDNNKNNNNNISRRGNNIDTFEDESIITVPITRRIDIDDDDDSRTTTWTATSSSSNTTRKSKISYYISIFAIFGATNYTIAFLICLVTLSSGQAIVNDLLFLFFEFLGGSYTLMSCTVVLTVIFEIPIFHIAPYLLKKCGGCSGLLIIASFSYIVRVIGYTFIPIHKPILALFLEPLHGITYASSQTAAIDFVSTKLIFRNKNNSNNDNDNDSSNTNNGGYSGDDNKKRNNSSNNNNDGKEATGQGFLQLFTGIGSVLGLVFGGYLESTLGPRIMYRISALVVLIGCTILVLVVTTATTTVSSSSSLMRNHHHHPHHAIPQTEEIVIEEAAEDTKNIDIDMATGANTVIEMTGTSLKQYK